ncbi:choline dehydrogenase [Rhizophagus irregularis DAOM 181602=DAOM 197198]|nr:choline dehydrogenase [Rhizophagus irregularis DAOM 181602=DAOM 197198]
MILNFVFADPPNTQVNDIVRSTCAFLRFFEQVKQIGNILQRGQKVDYDLWAAQGPDYKIWDYNHCIEAFKAVENIAHKSSDEEFKNYHGFNVALDKMQMEYENIRWKSAFRWLMVIRDLSPFEIILLVD